MTQIICKVDAAHFIPLIFAASLYHILRKRSYSIRTIKILYRRLVLVYVVIEKWRHFFIL
jgi:hypothetical protein